MLPWRAVAAVAPRPTVAPAFARFAYYLRVLRVIVGTEFKLKYADSALGYVWSLLKPLALFSVLYVVFGRFFKLTRLRALPALAADRDRALDVLRRRDDARMPSVVSHGSLLRKLAFPRIIVPVSATLTAAMTFAVNAARVAGVRRVEPDRAALDWLLLLPLLVELYAFTLGVSLVLATMYVRFRDIGQIWELGAQLLF